MTTMCFKQSKQNVDLRGPNIQYSYIICTKLQIIEICTHVVSEEKI